MEPKEQRKVDDFILFGVAAATQALADAGWAPGTYQDQIETGVMMGAGIGGLGGIYEQSLVLKEKGPRRVSPFFVTGRIINLISGYISIEHHLKGPNHAVVTACATGTHAIGDAARRGRRRIGRQPAWHRGLLRLPRAVDRVQRPSAGSVPAL
jgi:3-oxoacyl-[acyl-carrier-protein] synthase II